MPLFGTQEILMVVAIAALLFGATAIPKLARAIGSAKGEYRKAQKAAEREAEEAKKSAP